MLSLAKTPDTYVSSSCNDDFGGEVMNLHNQDLHNVYTMLGFGAMMMKINGKLTTCLPGVAAVLASALLRFPFG
jgi:hypothetical protein